MSKLLSNQSTPIPKTLADQIVSLFETRKEYRLKGYAVNCAAMVQQIHYYICQEFGSIPHQVKETLVDGRRWIYKSYSSWQETFSWLSDYAFRKVRSLLVDLGLIEVSQLGLRQSGRDRTCWYTVNYNHPFLQQLLSTDATVSSSTTPSVDCQRIPETTNNTTGNIFSNKESEPKKQEAVVTAESSDTSIAKPDIPRPKPKISLCDKSSEAGGVRMDSDTLAASAARATEPWEVAPLQPYPYFLQWRALHYKNQGGHWADSPQSNAYAEFYKNRFKTAILWQEFLQFYNLALDNALALEAAGIEVRLPSCLSEVPSTSPEEVTQKAKTLSNHPQRPRAEIAPVPDFSARLSALVRQRTLPPTPKKQQLTDSLQMYLEWLHGQEPVLVEEARKKLTRLVMERSDLLADWDERGRLIDIEIVED
ncbi:MAG: hypothetical protein N4J56_007154 [Chroococcidiopsis sp. SAG 2025]|uniref:hypothetical protein n=1 Tax=Chroococcidiopsis sp. SAG 2025 TaxID=171389 RepID=UPI002936F75F|nr:hypothetical protein [Chroococcidiopsis sp. SAG 2025]MDV2997449.1 hypothetical protein [Chroococcidiopsis sp. SAG 2025]